MSIPRFFFKSHEEQRTHVDGGLELDGEWIELPGRAFINYSRSPWSGSFDVDISRDILKPVATDWSLSIELETVSDDWAERIWSGIVEDSQARARAMDMHLTLGRGGEHDPAMWVIEPHDWRALWRQMKAIMRYEWRKATGDLVYPWARSVSVYGMLLEGPIEAPPIEIHRDTPSRRWPDRFRFRARNATMIYEKRRGTDA